MRAAEEEEAAEEEDEEERGGMGKGKGRKRREANYRAAHGGHPSLPAPPTPADAMAIPSKLRHIMSLKASNASSSPSLHLPRSSQRTNGKLHLPLSALLFSESV